MRKRTQSRAGVALIEFTVGLIAVIVAVGAMVQLGLLGMHRTDTMITATREASLGAMAEEQDYQAMPDYMITWSDGDDDSRHSEDDNRVIGSPDAFQNALSNTARPGDLSNYLPDAPLADITSPERLIMQFRMVRGVSTHVGVDLLPVVRNLVYREDSLNIRSEAWSVRTRDL